MRRKDTEKTTMQAYVTLQKRIMRRLVKAGPRGLTRSGLSRSLSSPLTKKSLDIALNALRKRSLAEARRVETGLRGRPSEVWWAKADLPEEYA